ncbi:putative short-chain dehydrogenase [Rosellinia necatrix]|uniref:Putative short-chain dehydrogenase n=1 Tax=Rosellinia necatrix TaxID=77044 RepID=A0A1W2THS8_ROSNE|nr:putative short-chain dehydrogenase [Rosellinia necatrix]
MAHYVSTIYQLFPGKPTYTEHDIPSLCGKVYLVTGANTGIGKEVAKILYSKNAAVWVTARDAEKGANAVASIKEAHPSSRGRLELLQLDLSDLSTIKASAEAFLAKEERLDVLFNNAGVMFPPDGSETAQGFELQLGTNCLGPFLFTQLLTPILIATAKAAPEGSVRVVWTSSSAADHLNPRGGIDLGNLDYKRDTFYAWKYGISKAGNYYHATEYARRHRDDGIVSVSLNPGNLKSELDRNCNFFEMLFRNATTYPTVNGAYTELFAGVSNDVGMRNSGDWIVPWGRIDNIRKDLLEGSKPEEEGGTGIAQKFWKWSDEQTSRYG